MVETKNYTRKAVWGVLGVGVTLFLASIFGFVLRVVLARQLTPEDFGLFYATISLMMFLLVFRNFGMGQALTKFIAQYQVEQNYSKIKTFIVATLGFQLISSSLLILFFVIFASYLSVNYFGSPQAVGLLLILAVYIFFSLLCNLAYGILLGFQETKWYSWTETIRLGVAALVFFPLFYLGLGIYAPALAFVIGVIVTFLFLLYGLKKYFFIWKYPLQEVKKTIKQLFSFSLPMIFSGVGDKIVAHLDVLIITYFLPLLQVGIYNVVLPAALLFLFFGRATTTILFPMASELWARRDYQRLTAGIKLIYTYSFLLAVPLILTAGLFAEEVIILLFGKEYIAGRLALQILLGGVLFYIITFSNHSIISAIGKPIVVTKIVVVAALVNVVLNLILIPKLGIVGAAIATAVSYFSTFLLSTIMMRKIMKMSSPWKKWFKTLLAGGMLILAISFVKSILVLSHWVEMIIAMGVGGMVYVGSLYFLDLINIKEIKKIIELVIKKS